jgi:hypothetical protein
LFTLAVGCGSSDKGNGVPGGQAGSNAAAGSGNGVAGSPSGGSAGSSSVGGAGAANGGSGGASASGGSAGTAAGTGGGSGSGSAGAAGKGGASGNGGPPALTVQGSQLKDPTGKTIVLRGSSLSDIGALYAYGGMSAAGITARMDKIASAGIQGHVVRLPVYPAINYNTGGDPTCSPLPYPVGSGPAAACTPTVSLSAADYVSKVLKPAVDYASSKNLYVIVDFHQIDSIVTGTSAADAKTFWTAIAPVFAGYGNVLYEPFNEPTDYASPWSALKPIVQGFVDTIRAGAPNNVIIVPSQTWDQFPGDAASSPPTGSNLMYTAHIYPSNWKTTFQTQVTTAAAKAPVFVSEWGYAASDPDPHTWGMNLQTFIDGSGASWTAWVTDNAWTPSMFADSTLTGLTDFGSLAKSWLAAKANSDWVQ